MRYQYIGGGQFLVGLPARDFGDEELSSAQVELLEIGLQLGLYTREENESNTSRPIDGEDTDDAGAEAGGVQPVPALHAVTRSHRKGG